MPQEGQDILHIVVRPVKQRQRYARLGWPVTMMPQAGVYITLAPDL